jgi:hypothetical protein
METTTVGSDRKWKIDGKIFSEPPTRPTVTVARFAKYRNHGKRLRQADDKRVR